MRVVYSLGSNLGDREAALRGAIAALAAGDLRLVAVSPVYETEPWGVVGHPDYLNVVAVFDDYDTAVRCFHSPEYQHAIAERGDSADVDVLIVEGDEGDQPADG